MPTDKTARAGAPQRQTSWRQHQGVARLALLGLLGALNTGCLSLAPDTETPPPPVPGAWSQADQAGNQAGERYQAWRAYFTDPALQRLIETALANNRDLRSAVLRVEEARAQFQIQRSDLFPEIGIDGQATRSRTPGDLNFTGRPQTTGNYNAQVGLSSWELDLWGRVRNLERSALESWLATDAARAAVRLSLIREVADDYLRLRETDERVANAQQTVKTREESYRIFRRRYEVGSINKLEVTQVRTLLTQAQFLLAQLQQTRDNQVHALQQLIGADPRPLPQAAPFDESTVLARLAPGLPSDLLTHRPDIIEAEHQLRAADANIGAARAAFFPRIALTGGWGTSSAQLDGLFDAGSRSWNFTPTLNLPIFDGGRRRANLQLSEVRSDLSVSNYEQTIQTAFREVADALSDHRWVARQLAVQRSAVAAQRERARLAKLRYDNGSAAYLDVLDAQRDLLDAEQQLVQSRRALLSTQVALYAALGGDTVVTGPLARAQAGPIPAAGVPAAPSTDPRQSR